MAPNVVLTFAVVLVFGVDVLVCVLSFFWAFIATVSNSYDLFDNS